MKFLAFALALGLAAPASASRVLVVDYTNATNYDGAQKGPATLTREMVIGALGKRVGEKDILVIPYQATKTLWVRNGYHVSNSGGASGAVDSCLAVFHVNYRGATFTTAPYNADSLTRMAAWGNVPQVFVPSVSSSITGKFTQVSNCSTGSGANGAWSVLAGSYAIYSTKSAAVFRTASVSPIIRAVTNPAGKFRVLLGLGVASGLTTSGVCTDCDALTRAAPPDSFVLAARYHPDASKQQSNPPYLLCSLGYNVGAMTPIPLQVAISFVDSVLKATRGVTLSTKTLKAGVLISGLYRRDNNAAGLLNGSVAGRGIGATAATGTEWANLTAGYDSLGSLGAKISIAVQTDSASALSYQDALLSRVPLAKLTPQNYAGTARSFTSGWVAVNFMRGAQSGTNASRFRLNDIWGASRTRSIAPADGACADADSSISCLIGWDFARAESLSLARGLSGVDRIVWAPNMDWTPSTITKANATSLDSVLYYAYKNGVRGFVTTVENKDTSPDAYSSAASHPLGWGIRGTYLPIYRDITSGPVIGRMKLLSSRADAFQPNEVLLGGGHNVVEEFACSWAGGVSWYTAAPGLSPPGPLYYHEFYTPVSVLTLAAGNFGGANVANPNRHAWWAIKGLKNYCNMMNEYGRAAAEIVYPQEIEP